MAKIKQLVECSYSVQIMRFSTHNKVTNLYDSKSASVSLR